MKNNIQRKRQLGFMLEYFKARNKLSVFPLIDTDYIKDLENMIKDNKVDHDTEPVICCAHCKRLCIIIDEDDNDKCLLCSNSVNETETHATIFHYLNKYPDRWIS